MLDVASVGGRQVDRGPALRVRGLHKRFGPLVVLRGVDLDLARGEILALVGENGAGKSTVVRCVTQTSPGDAGAIELLGRPLADDPVGARDQGVAVVWQDLALCDNLSVVANLFLGGEHLSRRLLDDRSMIEEARSLFARLNLGSIDLQRPLGTLSGGQRQLVAIARAVRRNPSVLILDEPTASLGVNETRLVEQLLADLRDAGTAILLVSHRLEQVFAVADRIAILRDGSIQATVSPLEVHPDDVVAMMSGLETVSTAGRQLRRLQGLVEQLADVEPSASLPLIVSALVEALGADQLCIHLFGEDDLAPVRLRRSVAIGVSDALLASLESLAADASGGPPGLAAAGGEAVVVEDTRNDGRWSTVRAFAGNDPRSSWSVPIVGSGDVLGTITGFADAAGRPRDDQLELVRLYASLAATAIERERLLAESLRLALERQALERANAETASLRRSQRMQRDFLTRLNHELRTPLTAIQGYASTLRQQDVSWDLSSQERFLDSIASESARMGRLVGDLLDFSAIDSGTLRLVPDWCDLALVLGAARRCVSDAPASFGEDVDDAELPPIWGDHDRLEQVFVNLLDNAVRHAMATDPVVTTSVDPHHGTVTVRVADDGPGIPRHLADRVFLPHERGTGPTAGAGLGLAIARGIVDAHGGVIRLEPVDRGTTVAVTLPIEPYGRPA
jgi:signal transduction histidine kinase/ABC-type multidrug transport system ATPase subunit